MELRHIGQDSERFEAASRPETGKKTQLAVGGRHEGSRSPAKVSAGRPGLAVASGPCRSRLCWWWHPVGDSVAHAGTPYGRKQETQEKKVGTTPIRGTLPTAYFFANGPLHWRPPGRVQVQTQVQDRLLTTWHEARGWRGVAQTSPSRLAVPAKGQGQKAGGKGTGGCKGEQCGPTRRKRRDAGPADDGRNSPRA